MMASLEGPDLSTDLSLFDEDLQVMRVADERHSTGSWKLGKVKIAMQGSAGWAAVLYILQ